MTNIYFLRRSWVHIERKVFCAKTETANKWIFLAMVIMMMMMLSIREYHLGRSNDFLGNFEYHLTIL